MADCSDNNRLDYIDVVKGIGMLLVVFAHILVSGSVNWFIYAFHMPLFFFISGVLYNPAKYDSCLKLIKKRIRTLLIPYVIYSVVTWIVWVVYSIAAKKQVESYWMPLLQTVIAQGSGGFLVHNVPLWFVTCLFAVEVLYYFVNKIKSLALKLIVAFAITALGYLMIAVFGFFPFNLLPWSLEVAFAAFAFYAVGSIFGKKIVGFISFLHGKNVFLRILGILLLAGTVFACSRVNRHISFGSDRLGSHPLVLYFGAFSGIFMMFLLSYEIASINTRLKFLNKVTDYIKWIGKNSFRFMAVHVPIKGFLVTVAAKVFHVTVKAVGRSFVYSGIVFIATMIIASVITMATNFVIDKIAKKRRERKLTA